jgi:ABC-type multidrug transport system ATPase subunit
VTGDGLTLSLSGITKHWPGAGEPLLDDVDLVVGPGSAVEIVAPNGTGKTTLLRIAVGLIQPESGRVSLGALDAESDRSAFQQRVGFVSAAAGGLYARLTVRDHLRLWSRLALLPPTRRSGYCARVQDALGLDDLLDRRVDRLSMGQRQRVRIAGAFLHEPDVVLMDEPAGSLDEDGLRLLAAEVERARDGGRAVLWCAPTAGVGLVEPGRRLTIAAGRLVGA